MAHEEQKQFIARTRLRFLDHFTHTAVLEIGSCNINGSVREFFIDPAYYVGLDLAPGKDVDEICHGADYRSTTPFDVVISTECFEHDERWAETFANMIQLCRSGGLVVFTCASHGRHEHGTPRTTPQDSALATPYYRNLYVKDFELNFGVTLSGAFSSYCFEARQSDLYFWGVKRG